MGLIPPIATGLILTGNASVTIPGALDYKDAGIAEALVSLGSYDGDGGVIDLTG